MKILNVFNKQKSKDRPNFILAQDGEVISTSDLEKMKAEIADVISKYMKVGNGSIDIEILQNADDRKQKTLQANIPIPNSRDRERENQKTVQ